MDAKIIKTSENIVLGRREITAGISFEKSTPGRKEIKQLVCSEIGANPDAAVLREVRSGFGTRSAEVLVHVYPTREAALATEPSHILARDGMAEKKPKKEKKKAAPAEEKK